MLAFLKLIRYKNLLMVLLTMILTKYALIDNDVFNNSWFFSNIQFTYLTLAVILITAGGYIINDIFDVETDKINRNNKVLIKTIFSKKKAIKIYFILTLMGLLLGFLMSFKFYYFFYFLIPTLFLFCYSKYLKKTPLLGNIIISLMISYVIYLTYKYHFISGCCNTFSVFDKLLKNVIYIYIMFSFLTTLIREIIKDIEDVNGDLKINAKTLPIVIGRKRASYVAFFFACVLLVFLTIVLKLLKDEVLFLSYGIVFILLPLLYFLFLLWNAETKKQYSRLSNLMKTIMFFGILSMLFFRFLGTSLF